MTTPDSPYRSDWPHAEYLLSGYFHEDYDIEGATDAEVVTAFARREDITQVEQTLADLRRLADQARYMSTDLVHAFIYDEACCRYVPQEQTPEQWIARLRDLVSDALERKRRGELR